MKFDLILLSGTPASGKDTLTKELCTIDKRFVHFKKHKIASGGKLDDTYYLVTKKEFDQMVENGEFLQYHYRYERGYGVSYKELFFLKEQGKIPIIHVGKYENIAPFKQNTTFSFLSILIYTNKDITYERLKQRHLKNEKEIEKRLKAYDEEIDILCNFNKKPLYKLSFDIIHNNNTNNFKWSACDLHHKIKFFEKNIYSLQELIKC
jgi:guanylate kinase